MIVLLVYNKYLLFHKLNSQDNYRTITCLVLYDLIFVCFYILDQGSLGHTGWSLVEMGQRSLRPQPSLIRNDFRYAAEMMIKKNWYEKKNRILRLFLQYTYMYLNSIIIYQKMILHTHTYKMSFYTVYHG